MASLRSLGAGTRAIFLRGIAVKAEPVEALAVLMGTLFVVLDEPASGWCRAL